MAVSTGLFLLLQLITISISLALLGGTIIAVYSSISIYTAYVPFAVISAVGIVSGAIFTLSAVGLVSILTEVTLLFKMYFYLTGICVPADIGMLILLILYLNQVETVSAIDSLFQENLDELKEEFPEVALEDADFIDVQNELKCCGINFESSYGTLAQERLLTGDRCLEEVIIDGNLTTGLSQITQLQEIFPEFNSSAQDVADSNPILGESGFFCQDDLEDLNEILLLGFALALFIIVFLQIISFVCTLVILSKAGKRKRNRSAQSSQPDQIDEADEPPDFLQQQASDLGKVVIRLKGQMKGTRFPNIATSSRKLSNLIAPFNKVSRTSFDYNSRGGSFDPNNMDLIASGTYNPEEASVGGDFGNLSRNESSVFPDRGPGMAPDDRSENFSRKSTLSTIKPDF